MADDSGAEHRQISHSSPRLSLLSLSPLGPVILTTVINWSPGCPQTAAVLFYKLRLVQQGKEQITPTSHIPLLCVWTSPSQTVPAQQSRPPCQRRDGKQSGQHEEEAAALSAAGWRVRSFPAWTVSHPQHPGNLLPVEKRINKQFYLKCLRNLGEKKLKLCLLEPLLQSL